MSKVLTVEDSEFISKDIKILLEKNNIKVVQTFDDDKVVNIVNRQT